MNEFLIAKTSELIETVIVAKCEKRGKAVVATKENVSPNSKGISKVVKRRRLWQTDWQSVDYSDRFDEKSV